MLASRAAGSRMRGSSSETESRGDPPTAIEAHSTRRSPEDGIARVVGMRQPPMNSRSATRRPQGDRLKFEDIEKRAAKARQDGQEIIVVLGLGFVGTAVVANLART